MSLATVIELLTILFCSAVLVQCWRTTMALDRFREVLATETEPRVRAIAEASRAADELGVMIGIANASADRLLDAAQRARPSDLAA